MENDGLQIPVIDFAAFATDNWIEQAAIARQVYQACNQIGFLYAHNIGIEPALIAQMFQQSHALFDLPLAVKESLAWSAAESNLGYVALERERLDETQPGDLKEAFNMAGPESANRWVDALPAFRSTSLSFYQACTQALNRILHAFALALELPPSFFQAYHDQNDHTLRLLHYPARQQPPQAGQLRAGAHTDYGSLTLLFQEDTEGLEVQTRSGHWLAAPPIPHTVVVNTGDLMQRWTNHVFCSTLHRVQIPSQEQGERSRYSIAFFGHPNLEAEIACLPTCQTPDHPALYPPITSGAYLLSRLQATY